MEHSVSPCNLSEASIPFAFGAILVSKRPRGYTVYASMKEESGNLACLLRLECLRYVLSTRGDDRALSTVAKIRM
jgi:hypothetical protein